MEHGSAVESGRSLVRDWLTKVESVPTEYVPVQSVSSGYSLRSGGGHVAEHLRALIESEALLPAIIVHRSTMKVVDGALRLQVAIALRRERIAAKFFDGNEADAFALAVQANVAHGLPLSLAERKSAAFRLMEYHPNWSDRLVASATGLSHRTVGAMRRRATGENGQLHARVGQDGRVRPLRVAEGRRIAAEVIRADPTASLRHIASLAGVSTGTVRDVRARLDRGEDPVPGRGVPILAADRTQPAAGATEPDHVATSSRSDVDVREARPATFRDIAHVQQAILRDLANDPALRFNNKGREILRRIARTLTEVSSWTEIVGDVPSHCRGAFARLALANAQAWSDLAKKLERNDRQLADLPVDDPGRLLHA